MIPAGRWQSGPRAGAPERRKARPNAHTRRVRPSGAWRGPRPTRARAVRAPKWARLGRMGPRAPAAPKQPAPQQRALQEMRPRAFHSRGAASDRAQGARRAAPGALKTLKCGVGPLAMRPNAMPQCMRPGNARPGAAAGNAAPRVLQSAAAAQKPRVYGLVWPFQMTD